LGIGYWVLTPRQFVNCFPVSLLNAGCPSKEALLERFERHTPLRKRDVTRRIVMGEALVPDLTDAQGDRIDAPTIEEAAWSFLQSSRAVGTNHREFGGVGEVVESFIARTGDPDFTPGAWVLAVKCTPEAWERVQSGELTGFSIGGRARRLADGE